MEFVVANFNFCNLLIYSEEGSVVDWSGIQWSLAVRLEGLNFTDGISLLYYHWTQTYKQWHLKTLQEYTERQLEIKNKQKSRVISQIE